MHENTNILRYFIVFSYNGESFFGFQKQPKEVSVQQTLENAISVLLHEKINIIGAGRTDTGVHAKKMYAHFDTHQKLDDNIIFRLNSFLPKSISIYEIFQVKSDLHARFSATFRSYEYYVSLEKNPFKYGLAWQLWRKKLDIDKMNKACEILFEYKDFSSFAKLHSDNKTNFCEIKKAFWKECDNELIFTISADRFLRGMVRAIVGTMVDIGTGKTSLEELHRIIRDKNRNSAGSSAPAHGLFLVDVGYDFLGKEM